MRIYRFLPFLCLLVLSGCASQAPVEKAPVATSSTPSPKFPRDDLGREVQLKSPANRVVSIGPGATETIFALGAGSKLVGRDQVSDFPEAALKLPIVGDYTGPFVEKTIALKPDLVIILGETYDKVRVENWQSKIGVPVVALTPNTTNEVVQGIQKIGAWLGIPKEAATLSAQFKPYLADHGLEGTPKAFFEVSRTPLWTAGKGTLINDLMGRANVTNVAFSTSGYKQYNVESLLAQNPDFYIVAREQPDRAQILRELRSHPQLRNLSCIKKGNVVVLSADWTLRPGPRLIKGIEQLKNAARAIQRQ